MPEKGRLLPGPELHPHPGTPAPTSLRVPPEGMRPLRPGCRVSDGAYTLHRMGGYGQIAPHRLREAFPRGSCKAGGSPADRKSTEQTEPIALFRNTKQAFPGFWSWPHPTSIPVGRTRDTEKEKPGWSSSIPSSPAKDLRSAGQMPSSACVFLVCRCR